MKSGLESYQKRIKSALAWYAVFALVVVPLLTVLIGTRDNIFTVSMSAMGSAGGAVHAWFIVWTIVFCAFFAGFTGYLLMLTKNTHSKIRILVYIAVGVLVFGNILPFVPEELPGFAEMHNFCAQISSISLALILMLFALTLHKHYPEVFKKALLFVLIIWVVLIVLMGVFGTKSITEMAGIILACIFLFTVAIWLFKTKDFDAIASLKNFDAEQAFEEVKRLDKKAVEAKEEYFKWETKARRARIEAMEIIKEAKHHKSVQGE